MCDSDPKWVYGLPLTKELMCDYALKKAPDCFQEGQPSSTIILVVEKFERMFNRIFDLEVCYDVFDEEFKSQLILVFHEENFRSSTIKREDEEFFRKELGIKEEGKWYLYVGAFHIDYLKKYQKRALKLGSIPSRKPGDPERKFLSGCSSGVVDLSNSVAAISV